MPLKKDENGKRWVEMSLLVSTTPERLWDAIATGQGYAAWFAKAEVEPRVGGTIAFDFGALGKTKGEVTVWEPPRRFGYIENEWKAGAPPIATEITIETQADGQCLMTMVHTLTASTNDWDGDLDGFERGWPDFFVKLRALLENPPKHR
jgi:uncharacterized protein YndB with AHSA1/START domain